MIVQMSCMRFSRGCWSRVVGESIRRGVLRLAETIDIDHSLGKSLGGFLGQVVTDTTS
jgi:hypothetical protein